MELQEHEKAVGAYATLLIKPEHQAGTTWDYRRGYPPSLVSKGYRRKQVSQLQRCLSCGWAMGFLSIPPQGVWNRRVWPWAPELMSELPLLYQRAFPGKGIYGCPSGLISYVSSGPRVTGLSFIADQASSALREHSSSTARTRVSVMK